MAESAGERLGVFFRREVLEHDTGHGFFEAPMSELLDVAELHPENAERLRNMKSVLERGPLAKRIDWHEGRLATREELLLFHEPPYVEWLEGLDPERSHRVTSTSPLGPGSLSGILAAAGTAIAALEHVRSGAGRVAYALVRPPGHHAQPARADGYCFVNNIGVAVLAARQRGLERVAVIDWDVHHGNGTQEGFYTDPRVLTVSLHMDHGPWGPSHRQTGRAEEVGAGEGLGLNLNVPLPFGAGDAAYLAAFDRLVAPAVRAFAPELVVIAAGQDASQFDPNGRQCVSMAGFNALARRAGALADEQCDGRLVLVQEGGYATSYAAYCLHATLEGAVGSESSLGDPIGYLPDDAAARAEQIAAGLEADRRRELAAAGAAPPRG